MLRLPPASYRPLVRVLLAAALLQGFSPAQDQVRTAPDARLRDEGLNRPRVMEWAQTLTDRFGPRLTGSPALLAAEQWAAAQLRGWGLTDVRLEPWAFGSPGWANERLSARLIAPVRTPLVCLPVAWTPGTPRVHASVVHLDPPDRPTREELEKWLSRVGRSVRGMIVLTGHLSPLTPAAAFEPRLRDADLAKWYAPAPGGVDSAVKKTAEAASPSPERLSLQDVNEAIDRHLSEAGALVRVLPSAEPHGILRSYVNRSRTPSQTLPSVVMRREDFGYLVRLVESGARPQAEFEIVNRLFPEGRTAHHVVAELPGSDRRDELVIVGAHIDSQHFATGAADNAIGCAIVMEALRLLKTQAPAPRRTIRLILWSGEEQRVIGSQDYVRRHFGSFEEPGPDFAKLSVYIGLDNGSGRIRGMRVFGPEAAAEALRSILAPLADLGVVGAGTYANRTAPGSDHAAFSVNGLPAIWVDQDPLDYGSLAWHSNYDTFDRLNATEAAQAAVVLASVVQQLADRDPMLPRFSHQQMPARSSR